MLLIGSKHGVNDDVWSRMMSGLVDTWTTPHEQYGGMLCFLCCFTTSEVTVTIDLNCIEFCCNKVYPLRLQKCFVDSNTSFTPPLA